MQNLDSLKFEWSLQKFGIDMNMNIDRWHKYRD